jgi:hypothetical protein
MDDAVLKISNELRKQKDTNEQQVFIDPATISLIFSILGAIIQGIRLYCQWKQNKKTGENIHNELLYQKRRSKRTIRTYVKNAMSPEDYAVRGEAIITAILEAGKNATPEYIEQLLNNGVTYEV